MIFTITFQLKGPQSHKPQQKDIKVDNIVQLYKVLEDKKLGTIQDIKEKE